MERISPKEIEELERQVNELKGLVNNHLDSILAELGQLKKRVPYELIRIEEAAEILGLKARQLHNLASDPDTPIHKYNTDGTPKTDNRKTAIRFNRAEILTYKRKK